MKTGADFASHSFRRIAAVLLDLDETLLDRTTSLIAFLGDQHARFNDRLGDAPFEAWRDRFLALDKRGHAHKSLVYPAILKEFGGDPAAASVLIEDYQANCYRHARLFPGADEILQALRASDLRLGIVTNGETELQMRHIRTLGLEARVDTILVSQAEGLRKPDHALFWRAASRLGVEADRCLFIGDNPTVDIIGAHSAGMRTAWFRRESAWPGELPPLPDIAFDGFSELLGLIAEDRRDSIDLI